MLRQVEHNLDAFLTSFDSFVRTKADNLQGSATGRLLLQRRFLQRTPE